MATSSKKKAGPVKGRVPARSKAKAAPAKKAGRKAAKSAPKQTAAAARAKKTAKKSSTKAKSAPARSTPKAAEVDADALEFIAAIDRFKLENGRPFPSWSEVLMVLRQLGYERR